MKDKTQSPARPLARTVARELTAEEANKISGGLRLPPGGRGGYHTNATGPNGDDPADPGDLT